MTDISFEYKLKNPYINKEDIENKRVPKILHNIWLPGYEKLDENVKVLHINIKQVNPDWDFMIWDESSISGIIKKYPEMNALYMNCSNLTGAILTSTCKTEIAKYVILKEYGGIYFDFEYNCTKPFDNLVSFAPTTGSSSSPVYVTYEERDWLEYLFSFGFEKYSSSWIAISKNHPVWDSVFTNLKKVTNKYELFEVWDKTLKTITTTKIEKIVKDKEKKINTITVKVIGDELKKGCNYVPNEMTLKTHAPCSSMNGEYNPNESFLSYTWSYIKCHYKQLLLLILCFLIIIGIHRINNYNSNNFSQASFPGMPGFGAPPPPPPTLTQNAVSKTSGKSLKRSRSRSRK
jgi:mannosyltransferase OCH1-like enzyme